LDHGLQVQKEQEVRQSIGSVLVDLGYLTRRRLRSVVNRYGKRVFMGELLLAEGVIAHEQLESALREQKASGKSLGEILVEKGILDEDGLARALGKQLDVPYVVPHSGMVDMKVFSRLPEQFVRSNSVLPLSEIDGVVTVTVADPVDSGLIGRLDNVFGEALRLATSSKSRIDRVIEDVMFRKDLGIGQDTSAAATTTTPSDISLTIDSVALAGRQGRKNAETIFDGIISDALKKDATDIHFEPQRRGLRIRYRINGILGNIAGLPPSMLGPFVRRAKTLAGLNTLETHKQQEGRLCAAVDGQEYDLRVATFPSLFGESMSIHCFSREAAMMKLEGMGMLPQVFSDYKETVEHGLGATLLAGPTGSGKTTSFYATLSHLNDGSRKIISIETPVEVAVDGIVQHNLPPQETSEIIASLTSAMQHDPDVIALGRITSDEVAETLFNVSMMGHKVFSTLHAEDSASALVRLCNLPTASSFLTSCSIVLVAQALVRRVCDSCAEIYVPSPKLVSEFRVKDLDLDAIDFRRGTGCPECMGSGFRGRTGIFEVFELGAEMQKALLERPSAAVIRQTIMKAPHFLSLRQVGFLKVVQGATTLEEVSRVIPSVGEEPSGGGRYTLEELCHKADLTLTEKEREAIR
jgi:type II secretory ATPase GspE/PulE/Tfp pilus assembly ATPase PilB-like protein